MGAWIWRPLCMALLCVCMAATPLSWADSAPALPASAFTLSIDAPQGIAEGLMRHLELQRYKDVQDLDDIELKRLIDAADIQARELLATWGHFSPRLDWRTESTPGPGAPRTIHLQVSPGPLARVQAVQWVFQGHLQESEKHQAQRQALQQNWALQPGQAFTQEAWSDAKSASLRQLTAEHYPLGRWLRTEARVDTASHQVIVELSMDSGPEVFLGPVVIEGDERYGVEQARRLANLPVGRSYRQTDLLEAQQRLVLSGFYDTVFVSLDTSGPANAMPVRIELRETPLQRWQLGLGVRSDTGPRMTVEHTQHRVPGLNWRAVSKLSVDRLLQSASLDLLAPPDESQWRWNLSGRIAQQDFSGYTVASQRFRGGRTQLNERMDRSYYLQYDMAHNSGLLNGVQESISVNYAWTWRRFDSMPFPNSGWGLGLEIGAGTSLGSERTPFTRSHGKALWLVPVGTQGHRLSLRGELGAVSTRQTDSLPSTQLFLTGGDLTVRGYSPNSIGVSNASGTVIAGRYLAVTSAEWLIPLRKGQVRSDWDALLFVDAGTVANSFSGLKPQVGAGVGARWRSPVGPLEIDLAQAQETRQWRLHVSVGFRF